MERKFKVAVLTTQAALRLAHGLRLQPPEGHLWFEDPITCDTMCDPVKCNDGRTYDRWTIINNSVARSPFTRRPFAIAVDDVDVRSWLFQMFPEQEAKFRAKRRNYRAKALQYFRDRPLEVEAAVEMLNNVLQWAPDDTECRNKLNEILRHISGEFCHLSSLPQEGNNQDHEFNGVRAILDESQTTPNPILRHELPGDRGSQGNDFDGVLNTFNGSHTTSIPNLRQRLPRERNFEADNFDGERSQTSPFPVISHEDLIRERYGQRRLQVLLFLLFYFGVYFFLFKFQSTW